MPIDMPFGTPFGMPFESLRVTVLGSGSGGNSILIEAEGTRILVDAGLSARELARRMEAVSSVRLEDIHAVLVTHEHSDHVSGIPALASAGIPVHATTGTARALGLTAARELGPGEPFTIGALCVNPVPVPHDASEPVGFVLTSGPNKVGILTDCGFPDRTIAAAYAGCDVLVLETNHDSSMLRSGPYPPSLKRRIGGARGHLSNEQAADLLTLIVRADPLERMPRVLVLAHLSQMNNRPRLARLAVERALARMGSRSPRPRIILSSQSRPSSPVRVTQGGLEILPQEDSRQLCLVFPD
ncbi:MAG: MBL fold metallo-hydrolase [Deltaproteobacteria bacterium]|nr:MBL fold metallo-hydrolase [Deltaproteobacteria bacterium]